MERPNPDELLARIKEEDSRRGKLKIFFGAAAGVGKTYSMLEAARLRKKEGVDIRTYRIIYEAIEAVKKAMEGMLEPEIKETIIAQIEVRQVFKVSKVGTIAGCVVVSGTVKNGTKARVIREDVEIADTKISSLRRLKDDVREVSAGMECGVSLEKFSDFKENDRVETYEETQVARKLSL